MKKYISNIKSFVKNINKQNTKEFMLVHKNALIVIIAIVLLGGIITAASYAYYQTLANQSIVGGQVGNISNINMYVYVEDKNESTGAGLGTYSRSVYIPQYAYTYNSSLSYCKKGSTLTYNSTTNTFSINNTKDACYVYFDASVAANADIILDIYQQKNGEYKKVNEIPEGYYLDSTLSSCTNGATMILENGQISVSTTNKTVCNAYTASPRYWNNHFYNSGSFEYPSTPSETYSSLALFISNTTNFYYHPVFIKTTSEHQACLYYNNHEFCLGGNYWVVGDSDGSQTVAKLQNDMETAFGASASRCNNQGSYVNCFFNSDYCQVNNNTTGSQCLAIDSGVTDYFCEVTQAGVAKCWSR